MNASAGISYCKFLAKTASDLNKPNGQAVITPLMGPAFVEALAVKKFHGVGPATAAKMQRLGIETGADLKAKSLGFRQHNFGKSGTWYYKIARGIDERPVEPDRPRKSAGAEDTFTVDIYDLEAARAELAPLVAKVWRCCEANSIRGRTVTLKAKYADFHQITRSRSLPSGVGSLTDLATISETLLAPVFPTSQGICLLGVIISNLGGINSHDGGQLSLID
ncbi:hypothetical protein IYY11_00880 [Methylocystis sp. H62]|nr:hypothetical protein [Methylocystis sp. H62]